MSISFQQIHPISIDTAWYTQPFYGFCLDSRKVEQGQIFIALNSYSQAEKTRQFAEDALKAGALAVISETPLGLVNEWVCADVRYQMGEWQKQYWEVQVGCFRQKPPRNSSHGILQMALRIEEIFHYPN